MHLCFLCMFFFLKKTVKVTKSQKIQFINMLVFLIAITASLKLFVSKLKIIL